MSRQWSVHGLTIACDTTLDARTAPASARPDVEIAVDPPVRPLAYGEQPRGRAIATINQGPGHPSLSVVELEPAAGGSGHAGAVELHFHGWARAVINADRSRVQLALGPDVDPDIAPVLLNGTVMAILLALRGHPVLHASAVVTHRDEAIGIVGSSGMGKSTTATLACRDGATLLADDVLRTDVDHGGGILAWPGATAARLRPGASALGEQTTTELRTTIDGRLSATPRLAPNQAVPLAALVVPCPDRVSDTLTIEPISGASAVITLASHPRVLGWTDPITTGQAHRHWGILARQVPMFAVRVPWGPPFRDGLGAELISAVLDRVERS